MSSSTAPVAFEDDSTDCAICLSPLSEHPVIQLSCGHKWHLHCIKQQLQHSHPNPARRLLFSGTRCAKCKAFCDHPALASLTRHTEQLRDKADAILTDLIESHNLAEHNSVTSRSSPYFNDSLGFARVHFALYLCSACEDPYFGGTVECADDDDRDLPPDDRLCNKCTPRTAAVCPHAMHTGFHVWKCRFCCKPATHVCYGSTHMCDSCHNEDAAGPTRPFPKECPGADSCDSPLPPGRERHRNGAGADCEQLLYCAWCTSDPLADGISRDDRGSPNLLYNTSGEHGLTGWTELSHARWHVEQSDFPFLQNRTNFVSTHSWCTMGQAVDLARFLRSPADVFVEVSARYMARTDCPSVFQFRGALLDQRHNVLETFNSEELAAPADYWDRARHIFRPTANARYAVIIVRGKDTRFWAGNYGSKVSNACVRVVYDANTVDSDVLVPGAAGRISADGVASDDLVHTFANWREDAEVAAAERRARANDLLDVPVHRVSVDDEAGGAFWGERVRHAEEQRGARFPRRLHGFRAGEARNMVQQARDEWSDGDRTNLLVNATGARGARPWLQLAVGSWTSVPAGAAPDAPHFRSSHRACVMTQAVDLTRGGDGSELHVRCFARFRARSARGARFRMELALLDADFRVLKRVNGAERAAVVHGWDFEELQSEPVDDAVFAALTLRGCGPESAQGGDGVVVRECAVRVSAVDADDVGAGENLVVERPGDDVMLLTTMVVAHSNMHDESSRARDQANCTVM